MSEERIQAKEVRKKRVKRLKKIIIITLIVSILVPNVFCFVLFGKLQSQKQLTGQLKEQLDQMTQELENRLEQLGKYYSLLEEQELQNQCAEESLVREDSEKTDPNGKEEQSQVSHKVYLTFDDGPSGYTTEILDILDRYQVKATFFVVGKENDSAKEALKEIVNRGHTLGMHSYSHVYSQIYESEESFTEDFEKLRDYLYQVTGVESNVYRFPGGSSNTICRKEDMQLYMKYLEEQKVRYFDWNISSGDASSHGLSVEKLVENVTKDISEYRNAMILFHDSMDKRTTVEALPLIIEKIQLMENTEILPITEDTELIQHVLMNAQ